MVLTLFLLLNVQSIWAQSADQESSDREALMKDYRELHEEILKSLREGGESAQFESRLEKLLENFGAMEQDLFENFDKMLNQQQGTLFDQFFQGPGFRRFLDQAGVFGHMGDGEFEWLETPDSRVLVARLELNEQTPLDIEIKDGVVHFRGESRIEQVDEGPNGISRSLRVQSFNRQFPIPKDCDPEGAKIDQEEGKIIVTFPKRDVSAIPGEKKI